MSKYQEVLTIIKEHYPKSRSEMVDLIHEKTGINKPSCNTYFYKAVKELGIELPKTKRGRKPGSTTRPFRKKAQHFLKWRKKKMKKEIISKIRKKSFDNYDEYDYNDNVIELIRVQRG